MASISELGMSAFDHIYNNRDEAAARFLLVLRAGYSTLSVDDFSPVSSIPETEMRRLAEKGIVRCLWRAFRFLAQPPQNSANDPPTVMRVFASRAHVMQY